MLLDELDLPLDDVVVIDRLAIADYNESNILPQDEVTLKRLHDWLRPTQYEGDSSELKKHSGCHLEGTSQWLLDSPIFQQWHDSRNDGILWVRGVPGAGKSVLASRLIHHLSSEEFPVLYFFFRHTIQSNHRPESALRDWLAQALPFSPPLQLALKNLIFRPICLDFVDDLSLVELWHLVRLALRDMPRAYCVVDALDEMDNNTQESFLQLIDQFGNMQPDRLKLIITSRPIATIEKMVRNLKPLDIRLDKKAINPDISTYLEHRLATSKLSPETRIAVKDIVFKKADGLFLYAKLTMDKIVGLQNEPEAGILESIERMPVNLSIMYKNLLREQMGRIGLPEGLQMLVLQLVTHATRPLRLLEITDCIKVTQPQYGQDTGAIKNHIRTCCGPLLEVLPDETVRVVHHSLTEYLFGLDRSPDDHEIPVFEPGPTHNHLANLCISYLQSGNLNKIKFQDFSRVIEIVMSSNQDLPPFMNYAIKNWYIHVKEATRRDFPQKETNDRIFSMLMIPKHVKILATLAEKPRWENGFQGHRNPEAPLATEVLIFSIKLGLVSFIESLLELCGGEALKFHGYSETSPPLHQAVDDGNLEIVRLLIKHGAELDEHASRGCTLLHRALRRGHGTKGELHTLIIESLLKAGADPWEEQEESTSVSYTNTTSPLQEAFLADDKTVAALFLPYIKTQGQANKALSWLIKGFKDPKAMRSILDLGLADINDHADSPTPLFQACHEVDPIMVSILLEAGADPNIGQLRPMFGGYRDEMAGANVLHALAAPYCASKDPFKIYKRYSAFPNKYPPDDEAVRECFRLVIDAGADVNHVDNAGNTPLHLAEIPLMAQLLLEAGADITAINCRNNTPLHVAQSLDVMKMILSKTDIGIRDRESKTMFFRLLEGPGARRSREIRSLQGALQLLDLGVDARAVDSEGSTALHYLASTEEGIASPEGLQLLERLMRDGVNPNLHNSKGEAAIHRLAIHGRHSGTVSPLCLRTFIELTKADINAVDSKGQTLLFSSIDRLYGNLQLLVKDYVGGDRFALDDTAKNRDTRKDKTFISAMTDLGARFRPRNCRNDKDFNVLRHLIELGADPFQADLEGNTIWHEAMPKYTDEAHGSPSLETLQNITALGIDPTKANNQGITPFHLLCEYNQPVSKTTLFGYLLQQQLEKDVNMRDYNGITALHIVSTYSTDLTMRLLELGADATLVTKEGMNVFHLASRCRQSNTLGLVLDWLRERTAKEELQNLLNLKDNRGRAPLYYACASGRFQSVELLINGGAVVEMQTYEGSALSGCVFIEEETKNWQGLRSRTHSPDSGAVLVDDTKRPKNVPIEGRLQETLDLVIGNAATPNWHLLDTAIAAAVEMATSEHLHPAKKHRLSYHPNHDYTVERLVQARKALGVGDEMPCSPEVQQCLRRREEILKAAFVEKKCDCGKCYKFPRHVGNLKEWKCYDAIPNYINEVSPRPEDLQPVLVDFAKKGMARLLDTLLTPETILGLGRTKYQSISSLMCAACESTEPNMPVIRLLVSKGLELGESKPPECSFLHVLSRAGEHPWWHTGEALPYLIRQGVYLETRDKDGLTPLNASLDNIDKPFWSAKATEMLLQAGADPNSVDYKGKSCLARVIGNKTVFKMLVDHGAIIDHSLLTSAILAKDVVMVEVILSSGADPNIRRPPSPPSPDEERRRAQMGVYPSVSFHEMYPLDMVISKIDSETVSEVDCEAYIRMIEMLLKFGADPNARFHDTTVAHKTLGKDAIYSIPMPWIRRAKPRATHSIRRKYLDLILQHPTLDVNLRDAAGVPLLHAALDGADEKTTQILIARGADVYARDNFDRNIFHIESTLLSKKDQFDDIVALAPGLLNQVDKCGRTPLHYALGNRDEFGYLGSLEKVEAFAQMLITAGSNVCAKDENGDTPLHLLLQRKWDLLVDEDGGEVWQGPVYPIMELLLSKGADINARNQMDETPIFSFFREGDIHVDMSRVYPDKGFGPGPCTYHSQSERQAMEEKRPVLWAFFEKVGVDWTAVNAKGQSLLHVVASHKDRGSCFTRLERLKLLMGKGLDPLMEDREHRTALDIAAANGAHEIMELFKSE
ncbi:ankyrin [Fusarium acutatum]|uniref:Ankyrin n=1 Tax=Fusarium acutatum TaxID=78861 RepID=A0A8H4JV54_9HYPO|nr:ankyrin [Fusarium acutatum]